MNPKQKTFLGKVRGFSLIELMTVVAIIAILSAIAVPQYMKYVKKSRTSEAVSNLGAIAMYEETYFSESDTYVTADPNPAGAPPSPTDPGGRKTFDSNLAGWTLLGRVIPGGTPLYFQYEIRAGQYNSVGGPVVTTSGARLLSPTTAVSPGAGACTFAAGFSASNLNIPTTNSSNWFYATAVGNQSPSPAGKCSVFIKVIDRPDLFTENELD